MPRILDSAEPVLSEVEGLHPGYLASPLTCVVFALMTLTFELGANFRFPASLRCQPYLPGCCKREENTQSLSKFAQLMSKCYPAQIFSYNKMLGQLHDAGNTVTLASYLRLLETAFLASGLELFSKGQARKRGSSPKLILWNNALVNAPSLQTFAQAYADGARWGRLVENAVGAFLLNHLQGPLWSVTYWRDANEEVDFVVSHGAHTWAVEVKSGRADKTSGLGAFRRRYPKAKVWLVGDSGLPLMEFFSRPAQEWFA